MRRPSPSRTPADEPLAARFTSVRDRMVALVQPLSEADCTAQSMPDASPAKWHLAHVTWFFETFLLERFEVGFEPFNPAYRVLFNSYYHAIGEQHARPERGLITRPGLADVLAYRANVDQRMRALLGRRRTPEIDALVELGLQHEQQHQELLLTDLKHLLSRNPLAPAYRPHWPLQQVVRSRADWITLDGGEVLIGHDGRGFGFDNEGPQHRVLLRPYALSNQLVTHDDWTAFIDDGGYRDPRWWLSAGWQWVQTAQVQAPLYWRRDDGGRWLSFTLHGEVPVDPHTPVTHVNLYEADAFAHWVSAQHGRPMRLPTEAEWEHAARAHGVDPARGNFVESGALHPMPLARAHDGPMQMFGDVWEWTSSAYSAYPGFQPWAGAVGEYNGKFMINQYVLRGGSCVTPRDHIRASYRNFFPADARWQFSGLRLACDLDA